MSLDVQYTPKAAAPFLGMHEKSIRDACAAGLITHVVKNRDRLGRPTGYLIPESAIREYLAARTQRAHRRT